MSKPEHPSNNSFSIGLVVKSTGKEYKVLTPEGEVITSRLRGNIRLTAGKHTNPVCVGDHVAFTGVPGQWVIERIEPRKNYIIRKSVNLSRQTHILASNIDLAFLVVTLAAPRTSTGFIDRFLVTAGAYHIPVVLLFNKVDMWTNRDQEEALSLKALYESLGFLCLETSATEGKGIEDIIKLSAGKVCMFAGHSGSGKTSIINAMAPGLSLKTGDVSVVHQKGKHTTTYAEMFLLNNHAKIIDTPGIKELGLVDMDKKEIAGYFPEFLSLAKDCSFDNCVHMNEPGCRVLKSLEEGGIDERRYRNYLAMYRGESR